MSEPASTHAPYVYDHHGGRLGIQYRAECPCGWAGVTWFSRQNAADDVERHRDRNNGHRPATSTQEDS